MKRRKISPYFILIVGFAGLILLGSLLLMLPFATHDNYKLTFIDALFTSTSAVCITGLLSVPTITGVFTLFGKIIIILLVEIGGLGFITIATFIFSLLGVKIGFQDRFLIKESLNQNSLKGMVRLVRFTVAVALVVQTIGAIINFLVFIADYQFWDAFGMSIFHSVSAFNNAGFDLLPYGTSLYVYRNNVLLNFNISALIIIGGIGSIVIHDIIKHKSWKKLSIHSKIVIKTSIALIIIGMLLFKLGEGSNISWLQALFNSVSSRTAGYTTVAVSDLTNISLLILMVLMFIGASQASTGGGVKTTTFYTVMKSILSFGKGKKTITYNRQIADNSIFKAFILIVSGIIVIFTSSVFISLIENYNPKVINDTNYLVKIIFEVFSAFGTVGNSMGITVNLHWLSKFILCLVMFFGRLGPITIISLLNRHWTMDHEVSQVIYLEEKIIIG